MFEIFNKEEQVQMLVDQRYFWYEGNGEDGIGAGAYMFRPSHCSKDAQNISAVDDGVVAWYAYLFIATLSQTQVPLATGI